MGVLHFLGLKAEFKGIFNGMELNKAVEELYSQDEDFSFIIELLESTSEDYGEVLVKSLYEWQNSRCEVFEDHYKLIQLEETDERNSSANSRKELVFEEYLLKGNSEKIVLYVIELFIDLMVAAHIRAVF